MNNSQESQQFFSDVVTGRSKTHAPVRLWSPSITLNTAELRVLRTWEKYKGRFDEHIETSIPGFREVQIKKIHALDQMYGGTDALIYDIGGSEGGFGKTLSELGCVDTINLDPCKDMEDAHNRTPANRAEFVREAFYSGFDDIETHNPPILADVVHESMTFQFMSGGRKAFIEEVVLRYLKFGGLFITEEKLFPDDMEEWKANEEKKKQFKLRHYSEEQLKVKDETVLTGMEINQAYLSDYRFMLEAHFGHFGTVAEYWRSGNFHGFVCSYDKDRVDEFLELIGDTDTEFTNK